MFAVDGYVYGRRGHFVFLRLTRGGVRCEVIERREGIHVRGGVFLAFFVFRRFLEVKTSDVGEVFMQQLSSVSIFL